MALYAIEGMCKACFVIYVEADCKKQALRMAKQNVVIYANSIEPNTPCQIMTSYLTARKETP